MILILGLVIGSAVVFALTIASFAWQNVVLAVGISALFTWIFRRQVIPRPLPPNDLALHLLVYAPKLCWYLLVDILKGTWQVAMITLGLQPLRQPGIVKLPLGVHSPYGVGPVGYFITLSPGSFMVDVDWDERVMLIHVIDASDPDRVRADAEKYYKLWEYGRYVPTGWVEPEDEEEAPRA